MFTWLGRMIGWYQSWLDSLNIRWLSQGACWTTSFYQGWSYRWLQTIGHGYIQVKGTRRDNVFFRKKKLTEETKQTLSSHPNRDILPMSVWRKRLFEQIGQVFEAPQAKRPRTTHDSYYFVCPKCDTNQLIPCQNGVHCSSCKLTIEVECQDLTIDFIQHMLDMVRSDHR